MSDPEKANQFKALGNEAFKNKNYEQAVNYFTQAIQHNPNDHVFYSNRSNSHVNLKNYDKALEDASSCISINATWPRGYERKGTALYYLDRFDEAVEAYKEGLKHDPENKGLKNGLEAAEKKMNESVQTNHAYLEAMMKLINNPETKDFIQDPAFMQKVQSIIQNPANLTKYMNDPKIMKAYEVLQTSQAPDFQNFMKNMQKNAPPPKQEETAPQPPPPQQKKEEPKKKE